MGEKKGKRPSAVLHHKCSYFIAVPSITSCFLFIDLEMLVDEKQKRIA